MKLQDILDSIYEDTEFILYEDSIRIGKFNKKDKGIEEYETRKISLIEPNDNKSIIITVEED